MASYELRVFCNQKSENSVHFSFSFGLGNIFTKLKVDIGKSSEREGPRHLQLVQRNNLLLAPQCGFRLHPQLSLAFLRL